MPTSKIQTHPKSPHTLHPHHPKSDKYYEGVGRRKTSIARVRVTPGKDKTVVNGEDIKNYLQLPILTEKALEPLTALNINDKLGISVKVKGGGIHAQSEAIRHGLSRALILINPDYKKRLRTAGFLTRDPRMVERKKYGLKKARRAPQWQKR